MNNKIVIWGDDHHNALGLLRMLGDRGFDILFLVHKLDNRIATSSRYCKKKYIAKGIKDALDYLTQNYTDKDNRAVLIFTADKFSEAANNNLSRLIDYFIVAGPTKEGFLSEIDDKYTMGKIAADCGIIIPETILIPSDPISSVNSFPAIIKPCSPAVKDFKTIQVKNRKQLEKVAQSFIPQKRYVIQQFIQKEADGLVYGCRTMDGNTCLAGICVRNRWSEDGCGSFGYITDIIPDCINVTGIDEFLKKIGFYGLFSVEYALTKDNAYFYEFNLRNDGTSVLFYNAGANIALAYVNSCFGIEEEVQTKVNGKQYLMHEILDRFNIYDGNVSRKQWLEDKEKVTLNFLYDPDDIKPYEIQKSMAIKSFIHHVISRSWINRIRLEIKNRRK